MAIPIKVLHVLHAFSAGGLENGLVNIINGSPEHLSHELCFLSQGGDFLNRLRRDCTYHELGKPDRNDFGILLKLRDLFARRDIDIIHTRNWAAFDGVLAAFLAPRPRLIHGEHGRDFEDPRGLNSRRNFMRKMFSLRVKKFVAVSRDLYRWLSDTVRIPKSKLVLIPNGVDVERFHAHRDWELRHGLGIAPDEFVVGTIGRLDPIKNHEGLIQAVRLINEGPQKVRLVIVGDGPRRPLLETLLRQLPSTPKPLLVGYRSDVERFYGLFDLFVLNSYAEGMSNTLLEAMASALPIICTAVGGNVELVADQIHGKHVIPGDSESLARVIREYLDSPELRLRQGSNSRSFVEQNYSMARMVERYTDLYQTLACHKACSNA